MRRYFSITIIFTIITVLIISGLIYRENIVVLLGSNVSITNLIYNPQDLSENNILDKDLSQNTNFKEVVFFNIKFYIPKNWSYLYSGQEIEVQFAKNEFALIYFFKKDLEEESQNSIISNFYENLDTTDSLFLEFNQNQIQEIINSKNSVYPKNIEAFIPNELIPTHEDIFPKYRIVTGNYELTSIKEINDIKLLSYKYQNNYVTLVIGESYVAHIYSNSEKITELSMLVSKIKDNRNQTTDN
jgi:hypothetical protein